MTDTSATRRPVVDYDHTSVAFNAEPMALRHKMLRECPVAFSPHLGGFWVLTRYEDVARAARDEETFSSDHDIDGTRKGYYDASGEWVGYGGIGIPPVDGFRAGFIEMDRPEYSHHRRLVNPLFAPAAIEALRPRMLEFTTMCIDNVIESGTCDFMLDVGSPTTAWMIMSCLGVDPESAYRFARLQYDPENYGSGNTALSHSVVMEMYAEFAAVLAARRVRPTDDWISYYAHAQIDGEQIPDQTILENVWLIYMGGVDTTANLLGHALCYLSEHPELKATLLADDELFRTATEEFLRFYSPVQQFARTVTTDTKVGACPMTEGDRVALVWAAANRDPEEFENPDEIVLNREPNRHMAFGVGPHRCVGSHFGRAQYEVMMKEILTRMPDFVIDPAAVVPAPQRGGVNILHRVPATFTPRPRRATPS